MQEKVNFDVFDNDMKKAITGLSELVMKDEVPYSAYTRLYGVLTKYSLKTYGKKLTVQE